MNTFDSVELTQEQKDLMIHFRAAYDSVQALASQLSLALMKLEESAMWMNKAISRMEK